MIWIVEIFISMFIAMVALKNINHLSDSANSSKTAKILETSEFLREPIFENCQKDQVRVGNEFLSICPRKGVRFVLKR